jgi:hypothetical protein
MAAPVKVVIARNVFPNDFCAGKVDNVMAIENEPLPSPPKPPVTNYYNVENAVVVQRNDCGANKTGSTVTYTVPAGKYMSTESQEAADNLALADIAANAHKYANLHGTCSLDTPFYSEAIVQNFYKNDCPGLGNSPAGVYVYTVPAGKYTSWLSQADADAQAQNDVTLYGQALANLNSSCNLSGTFYTISLDRGDCRNYDSLDFTMWYTFTHPSKAKAWGTLTSGETIQLPIKLKKSDFPVKIWASGTSKAYFYAQFAIGKRSLKCKMAIAGKTGWTTCEAQPTAEWSVAISGYMKVDSDLTIAFTNP